MRILINALAVLRGGHKTYFSHLIPQLGEHGKNHEFILLHAPWQESLDYELPSNFKQFLGGPKRRSIWLRILWETLNLPKLLNELNIDVYYAPVLSSALASNCVTVVDARNLNIFMRLDGQNIRYTIRNRLLGLVAQNVVQRSRYILFVSDFSRNAALRVLNIDPSKTKVIYHGTPMQFIGKGDTSIKELYNFKRPYILTVSTIQTHKNYLRMLEAFAELCRKPDWKYDYIFAGAVEDEQTFKKIVERIGRADLNGQVHYLGEVDYRDLPPLYKKASLVVLPSLREAFCLPLVEAMASRVPIAAADNTCMPEIGGDAALYFDPFDIEDMAETIWTILRDDAISNELIEAGKYQSQKYSWSVAASTLVKLFESAENDIGLDKISRT